MTDDEKDKKIKDLEQKVHQLENRFGPVRAKVSPTSGCITVYGLMHRPVNLFRDQWQKLFKHQDEITKLFADPGARDSHDSKHAKTGVDRSREVLGRRGAPAKAPRPSRWVPPTKEAAEEEKQRILQGGRGYQRLSLEDPAPVATDDPPDDPGDLP